MFWVLTFSDSSTKLPLIRKKIEEEKRKKKRERERVCNDLISQLDKTSLEIYQYFQEWSGFSSILLAIDDVEVMKSKLNISITYKGSQMMHSYVIPRTISVIGNDYELTLTIKNLKFT